GPGGGQWSTGVVAAGPPPRAAAEIALERRAATAADVVGGHLCAVDVGERRVEVPDRRPRATATTERSHPHQRSGQDRDRGRACSTPLPPANPSPPTHASLHSPSA